MMILRYLEGTDAERVVTWRNANAEFFPAQSPWTVEGHLKWHARYLTDVNDFVYMVCLDDGTSVGTIGATKEPGDSYEIGRVLLGVRGPATRGIMGEALEEVVRRHEADCWWLKVLRNNPRAIAFYLKHDFNYIENIDEWAYMTRVSDDPAVQAVSY